MSAQDVNAPVSTDVNTDWLAVGHVDEVVSFVSDAQRALVADPEVCWALLVWADAIDPNARMLQNMNGYGPNGVSVHDIVTDAALRTFNFSTVMNAGNLPDVRAKLALPSPESAPSADGGNTGNCSLAKGGALTAFFPNSNVRYFRMTFTSSTAYDLEYREEGDPSWTSDGSGGVASDEVFTGARCFLLAHWWSGTAQAGDRFEFSADPTSVTLEVPVLFRDYYGSGALALTNNHVNCLVDGATVVSAEAFGPHVDYTGGGPADIVGDYVAAVLARAYTWTVDADDRAYYHNYEGSIHCGTNCQRTLHSFDWWEN